MPSELVVDVSEIRGLADDLRAGYMEAAADVRAVVGRGALNVKRDWAQAWTGLGHAPALARAITYDTRIRGLSVEAEIGPDKNRRQGPLGNIIEYGTAKNPPHPGGGPALAREEPRFVSAMEKVTAGLLR